jgi:hypothetical protein
LSLWFHLLQERLAHEVLVAVVEVQEQSLVEVYETALYEAYSNLAAEAGEDELLEARDTTAKFYFDTFAKAPDSHDECPLAR